MKKKIVSLMLMSALSVTVLYVYEKNKDNPTVQVKEEYVPVEVEEVGTRNISEKTTFSGKIIPKNEISVTPKIPGKVTSLNVEVGAVVKGGDVLFTVDNEDFQRQVDQAKKSVDLAKSNYDKTKQLSNGGSIPGVPDLDVLRIQVEQAELGYKQAQDALKSATVSAPTSGLVSQVNVSQGEMASNVQPSMVILDTSSMYVKIDVPENIISKINIGDSALISIPSSDYTNEGVVEIISPSPDERTQLYSVKILVPEVPETTKSGMFAKISLDINPKEGVIAVRSDSIIEDGTKNYIFKVEKGRAVRKEVGIGIDAEEYTEIMSGLKKSETILIKGQNYVEDGTKVKIIRGDE